MKIIILMLLLGFTCSHAKETVIHTVNVLRVIDGDTVVIEAPYLPDPLKKELSVRIYGVDTPEKGNRAKCIKEQKLSIEASEFTKQILKNAKVTKLKIINWDKYGGRLLGDIIVDGLSLREILLEKKLAKEYQGDKKKSWC